MDQPQPDFSLTLEKIAAIGQDFSAKCVDLGYQFSYCGNLPPNASANELAAAITELKNTVVQINTTLDRKLTDLDGKVTRHEATMNTSFNELKNRVLSGELNAVARSGNSKATHKYHRDLLPLHSPFTAEPIPGFPRTVEELQNLPRDGIVEFLKQLDLPTQGSPEVLEGRFKAACGVLILG
ncbi:hypothetical protein F5Y10DRAFT_241216 [Nemania abortiva]|nr:hypothetical protein F5Y10DRAFT_241216 [Nemania abortiva]